MHIQNLTIRNFRGIKNLVIEDLKMVNIFLGKNNVGKTSVLEAIFLSLAPGNPQIIIAIDNFRSLLHTNADDFKLLFYQLNYDNTIEVVSKYYYDELEKSLKITPNIQSSVLLSAQKKDVGETFNELSSTANTSDRTPINGLKLDYSFKKRHSKHQIYTAKIELENGAFKQTPAKNAEFLKATIITPTTLMNGLSQRFEKIVINKQESSIIKYLNTIDDSVEDLTFGANNILLVDTGFGKRFPINLMGDGACKLIAIMAAIYDTQNGIVLIDEFSTGMHYSALQTLWRAIFETAAKNNVQIFLTTHSYESLKHLKYILEQDANQQFQNTVRSYTIRKLPNGNFKSYLYDFAKLEMAINEDNEIR